MSSNENDKKRLAQSLKTLRQTHGYTQSDIAGSIDIQQATYSNYERGKRMPSSDVLFRLANFFGLTADDLMKYSINLDDNIYFEAPKPSPSLYAEIDFQEYQKGLSDFPLTTKEKHLLYYFSKLDRKNQDEVIFYTKYRIQNDHR